MRAVCQNLFFDTPPLVGSLGPGLLLMEVVQDLLGVDLRLDFLGMEDFLDHAVFVHQVSGAQRAHGLASAKGLFAPAAEGLLQGGLGVGDEGEVQAVFLGKFQLSRTFVAADADDGVAGSLKLGTVGLQGAGFTPRTRPAGLF